MEKDTINYMKYKMGFSKKILLVDEAVPTKFHCQEDRRRRLYDPELPRDVVAKRKRMDILKECEEENHLQNQNFINPLEEADTVVQEIIEPEGIYDI